METNIPNDFFDKLQSELPDVETFVGDFFIKNFEYKNQRFAIYFYKVKDYGPYFWICNPSQIHERI